MCRLFAITSNEPISPIIAIKALDVMKEGHDGSGLGLYLTDLGGRLENLKGFPILSGIFSESGLRELDNFMSELHFTHKHRILISPQGEPPKGTPKRDYYLIRVYDYPNTWASLSDEEREYRLMMVQLALREKGERDGSMQIFSFWPDVVMIKEIGDPMSLAAYLGLDRNEDLRARVILAQGRQNTNYAIDIYACHPFFIQGFSTMTNGENTAFVPIREYLTSRNFPGYIGYKSDSEVFTHILHFSYRFLKKGLRYYKHIITPLRDEEIERHPNRAELRSLKHVLRPLIIDGPNCVIGCLPDKTIFMVQDSKKLRPGVVGGHPGMYAFSSEICGLDAAIPVRDKKQDFQPMKYDTVSIPPGRDEVVIWNQLEN